MSEVKRVGAIWNDICESIQLRESPDGEFVKYEDYAELKAQRDALAAENAAYKSAIVIAKDGLQEHYDTDGVDSQDSEGNFMDACVRLCDAQSTIEKLEDILTPATAAYLNSVRADAVASFAHHQRVIADSETDPTIQRGHRITACRAEDFAAQLRTAILRNIEEAK